MGPGIGGQGHASPQNTSNPSKHEKRKGEQMLEIVTDTREQLPFFFDSLDDVVVVRKTLPTGDYSLLGHENDVTVERKSLADLVACLSRERPRFMRELERMRTYRSAVVVVEEPQQHLQQGLYHSEMTPKSAWQSVVSIMQEYRLPFAFCDGRDAAERFVYDFLRHYQRHQAKESS